MNLNELKRFAQEMRRDFIAQVGSRLDFVFTHDDEYLRAHAKEKQIIIEKQGSMGREALVEEAAYLWFNRFAAFRYMDARGYTNPRVLSPRPGETQPELLSDIKADRVPEPLIALRQRFDDLLSGRINALQPEREVYKDALLGVCNAWADSMPWLFSKVEDWVGLLLPQDLLSADSLVARMVAGISENDCAQGVEIIGWIYQFYISEKKDAVFAGLKKNIKITKENIPAATQLFTPHWIVRFMVENSLGRLWLLNHPESKLRDRMKYYVESDPEPDFLRVSDPTELKCLDPCCGSGHILAYFFELLYAIYEERGYAPQEIPALIIEHNIYGIDIDERAAQLAAFTLAMVAREKDRHFFERGIIPHVVAMRDVHVDLKKLDVRLSPDLQESLELLKEGRTYGSLIPVLEGASQEIEEVEKGLMARRFDDLFTTAELDDLKTGFRILKYLEPRYHVVVTNPPYMNASSMNPSLKNFVASYFEDYKGDLFSAFIVRSLNLAVNKGNLGLMAPFVWMFISSYEKLRSMIIAHHTITGLVQLEYSGFDGATVPICTFSLRKGYIENYKGGYIRLSSFRGAEIQGPKTEEAIANPECGWFYRVDQRNFPKIPGSPIAYWASEKIISLFEKPKIIDSHHVRQGIATSNNDLFVRKWFEVSINLVCMPSNYSLRVQKKWYPYNKGGGFRKWFGNNDNLINWENNGSTLISSGATIRARAFFFKPGITYCLVSSFDFSSRVVEKGYLFDVGGSMIFPNKISYTKYLQLYLASKLSRYLLKILNPTLNYQVGDVSFLPDLAVDFDKRAMKNYESTFISKSDWDLRETSWDFQRSPLLTDYTAPRIDTVIDENLTDWSWPSAFQPGAAIDLAKQAESFQKHWTALFLQLHHNEEENNRIFIELYGLQDELTPEVPYTEITILQDELVASARKENRIEFDESALARQFVSYGVGCLMGRYSVEKDGLILADAGATLDDFKSKVPNAHFLPDEDGIIPLTDEDDFSDDLPTRFKAWLRFISGSYFEANLRWIEDRLGKDLRSYFAREFYKDHLKRYKNRPIYWMASSPSGSFRALFYMHRYTKDTVGKILNDYLRVYRTKMDQKITSLSRTESSEAASKIEKARAQKRIAQLNKYIGELDRWERDALYPAAQARIDLDLDDGVKVNYRKLSSILEPVKQFEAKEEE